MRAQDGLQCACTLSLANLLGTTANLFFILKYCRALGDAGCTQHTVPEEDTITNLWSGSRGYAGSQGVNVLACLWFVDLSRLTSRWVNTHMHRGHMAPLIRQVQSSPAAQAMSEV